MGNGINIGTRLKFLGVLSESLVKLNNQLPRYFLGLGSVIRYDSMVDFINSVIKKMNLPR